MVYQRMSETAQDQDVMRLTHKTWGTGGGRTALRASEGDAEAIGGDIWGVDDDPLTSG